MKFPVSANRHDALLVAYRRCSPLSLLPDSHSQTTSLPSAFFLVRDMQVTFESCRKVFSQVRSVGRGNSRQGSPGRSVPGSRSSSQRNVQHSDASELRQNMLSTSQRSIRRAAGPDIASRLPIMLRLLRVQKTATSWSIRCAVRIRKYGCEFATDPNTSCRRHFLVCLSLGTCPTFERNQSLSKCLRKLWHSTEMSFTCRQGRSTLP